MTAEAESAATVYQAFSRTAERHPGRPFLCVLPHTASQYGIAAREYSYEHAAELIAGLRSRYAAAGLGSSGRVGLMLENRPAMFFHWLALNALGVSVVPLNPEFRRAELAYVIDHAELALAVVPDERAAELSAAAAQAGRALALAPPDLSRLEPGAGPDPVERVAPAEHTECALLYTSGTTGRPKGCVLTNDYFLAAGRWYAALGGLCRIGPAEERLLTPLPMSHMNAMAFSTMVMVLSGGCIVPLDRFHPGSWWESVRASRASIVHYLGVMPAMLLGAAPGRGDREHRVRFGFGAGVSPRLHAPFEQRFGFPLIEAWAMTETGAGAVIIAQKEPRKVGTACFGRPAPEVQARIVNDNGAAAARGEPGELLVRAAGTDPRRGFFREYLKDPEATDAAWKGGYFHTGDIVCQDEDGDLHFIDRRKNVIRRSGENIAAVEVEGVLMQHARVAAVGIAAVADEVRGEEVMACIVTRGACPLAERAALARDIQQFCLERLAYYKAPGFVAFCDSLPVTATAKLQRAELKSLARERLLASECLDLRAYKKRSVTT